MLHLKRILAMLVLCTLAFTASAAKFKTDNITYHYENYNNSKTEVIITKVELRRDSLEALVVPSCFKDKKVVAIGERCFAMSEDNSSENAKLRIKSIKFPSGLKHIGRLCFYKNNWLRSIEIPDCSDMGYRVFAYCESLSNIKLGNGVLKLGDECFLGCTGLTDLTIPGALISSPYGQRDENVEELRAHLKNINITGGLKKYSYSLLRGFKELTTVNLPYGETEIWSSAFEGCSSLTSINIPNSVTEIWSDAFSGCSSLTSINIPNSVTEIGRSAFEGCSSLTSINIPNRVTKIGYQAFKGCTRLTSVDIPNSVTLIENGAFKGCTRLTSVSISNGLTELQPTAFEGCTRLIDVKCPENWTADFLAQSFGETPFGKKYVEQRNLRWKQESLEKEQKEKEAQARINVLAKKTSISVPRVTHRVYNYENELCVVVTATVTNYVAGSKAECILEDISPIKAIDGDPISRALSQNSSGKVTFNFYFPYSSVYLVIGKGPGRGIRTKVTVDCQGKSSNSITFIP